MITDSVKTIEYPPAFYAISAYYGTPTILPSQTDTTLFDTLPEDQAKRVKSALREQLSVIPRAKGMYWIVSYSNNSPDLYSVQLDAPVCTCSDFMYNCDPNQGLVCKHIWRIRILLNLDALPKIEDNPYNWLLLQLEEDRTFLQQESYTSLAADIQALQQAVIDEKSWKMNYFWAYRRRAEILQQIPSVSFSEPQVTPKETDVLETHPKKIEDSPRK